MVKSYFLAFATFLLGTGAMAQTSGFRRCAAQDALAVQLQQDPQMQQRMQEIEAFTQKYVRSNSSAQKTTAVTTIPVVVHVIYNTASQNISDCQIQSQIAVLNEDFRKLNADNTNTPALFSGVSADSQIEFVLAKQDPSGNATTGITRTATTVTTFSLNNAIKYTSQGGHDAWDTRNYLNFWIAPDLRDGVQQLLGYGQFPGGPRDTDGVVMAYAAFGSRAKCPSGVYYTGYDLGRTTTHEVGHLMNLRHIWGDINCGDDLVSDTPTQADANFGCPTFPHVTCSNSGDMSMNFMDYTDDQCMYMFTTGQAARMNATLASGGYHYELTTSLGKTAPATLPVELSSFSGKMENHKAVLTWQTASEKDNAYFSVEHATDGRDFKAVAKINGNGTNNTGRLYYFSHDRPAFGQNYYRLKQVDLDGKYTYSKVVVIENNRMENRQAQLFPNPVNNELNLTYNVVPGQNSVQIELIDLTGKVLATYLDYPKNSGRQTFNLKVATSQHFARLPNGMYLCRISGADQTNPIRFVIAR